MSVYLSTFAEVCTLLFVLIGNVYQKNELVKKIRLKGISIISEIEFAFRYKGDSKIIAITGSNGKTTTTALTWHICKNAGMDCAMVGNIGYSFARQLALDPKSLYVIEISSFQLDDIKEERLRKLKKLKNS